MALGALQILQKRAEQMKLIPSIAQIKTASFQIGARDLILSQLCQRVVSGKITVLKTIHLPN
jgi:hypothetical protein